MASGAKRSRSSSSSRRRFTRGSGTDDLKCPVCDVPIPYEDGQYIQLKPCGHLICFKCLLDAHAKRGQEALVCQECDELVDSHQYHEGRVPTGEVVQYNMSSKPHFEESFLKTKRPVAYLTRREKASFEDAVTKGEDVAMTVLFSFTILKLASEDKKKIISKTVTMTRAGKDKVPEEKCDELCQFFSLLKHHITDPSILPYTKISTLMPRELFNHAINNFTPLMACIYGLATGHGKRNLDKIKDGKNHKDWQSQYLAVIAASDIILRCSTRYPCHFQLMLADQLEMQEVTRSFQDHLSAFRASTSREYSNLNQCKAVVESLLKGVSVGPNDMALLNGDNIGFKRKGDQASYDQWIMFQDIMLRAPRLKQLKIIADDNTQLSRDPENDWLELVEEYTDRLDEDKLADDLVGITDEDYDVLSHCVLEGIHIAIECEFGKQFKVGAEIPRSGYIISHEQRIQFEASCSRIIEEQHAAVEDTAEIIHREMPRMYTPREDDTVNDNDGSFLNGLNHGLNPVSNQIDELTANLEADESSMSPAPSAFYGHDIKLNAVHADLSKKQSTCMILKYIWEVRSNIMKQWYDDYVKNHGRPPSASMDASELPPAYIGAFFMCDGQPAAQISGLMAADYGKFYLGREDTTLTDDLFPVDASNSQSTPFDTWLGSIDSRYGLMGKADKDGKGSRFMGKVVAFPGGFHATMKLYNCCGMMFGNFVSSFVSAWRDSENKINWILYPKDPRQLENELPQYMLAHYRSAYLYCWKSLGGTEETRPSAAEVHKYMLDRAKDSPFRQAVLLQLRYADISKIMRNAAKIGKRGSVKHFLTAVRFAITIYATAHAVDYVRLCVDSLVLFKCASPALKELYANEIFTRLSATGKPMYTDLNMEHTIKDTRGCAGKVARPNMAGVMERASVSIPTRPAGDHATTKLRHGSHAVRASRSKSTEWLKENSPSILGFDLIHNDMQLWHPTNQPIIGKDGNNPIYAEPNSYTLPGKGNDLNPQVLNFTDVGSERANAYTLEYYINHPFAVERSEKKVALTKILASSVDRREELKKSIDKFTSLDKDELDKSMDKDEVGVELNRVVHILTYTIVVPSMLKAPPITMNKMNKKERVKKLIELRRIYFKRDPTAKSKYEAQAKVAFDVKYPQFTAQSRMHDLCSKKIYCLSENVLNLPRYKGI